MLNESLLSFFFYKNLIPLVVGHDGSFDVMNDPC